MSDQEIRQALLREAIGSSCPGARYSLNRASPTTSTTSTITTTTGGPRNRPNRHFLSRVVAGVDSHNGSLKQKERERASRKFDILDRFIKEELERDENNNRAMGDHSGRERDTRSPRAGSVSSSGTVTSRVTRFDQKPENLQEIQPSTSSTHNVKFSSEVDKIVRHHKEQAEARNKIYALTSIYNEPQKQTVSGLPISGLSGAEQVGMGYDEEEDYDKQSVTKRRKKRRRFEVKRDGSSDEESEREERRSRRDSRGSERSRRGSDRRGSENRDFERRDSERRDSERRRSQDTFRGFERRDSERRDSEKRSRDRSRDMERRSSRDYRHHRSRSPGY